MIQLLVQEKVDLDQLIKSKTVMKLFFSFIFLHKIYSCSYLFSVDYDDLDNFTALFVFEKLFNFYNIKIK